MERAEATSKHAESLVAERRYKAAIAELNKAIRFDDRSISSHYLLAWIYATCPDPEVRNARLAVKQAKATIDADRYFDQFGNEDKRARWMGPAVLAASYAECGEYDRAVAAQRESLNFVEYVPEEDRGVRMRELVRSRLRAALKLYEHRKPLRTYETALSKVSDEWVNSVLQARTEDQLPAIAK